MKVGNASVENSQGGMIYDLSGIFPTICACTHGYAIGYIACETACEENATCGEYENLPAALRYKRTEYAKKIRKDYEAGKIKERRCNMREYALRTDGFANTITTVTKDNYIVVESRKEYLDICINDKGKINKEPQITHGYAPTLVAEFHGNLPKVVEVSAAAMRGRYNSEGRIEQQIEVRDDELSNAVTTVQKDSLIVEKTKPTWLGKKYLEFYKKHGYVPQYFEPYNCREITDFAPTLATKSNMDQTKCGTVLIVEPRSKEQTETIDDGLSNAITTVQKDSLVVENFQKPPMN